MVANLRDTPTDKLIVMLRLTGSWPIGVSDKERDAALERQRPVKLAIEKELAKRKGEA